MSRQIIAISRTIASEINKTGSWRTERPFYQEAVAPCSLGCPIGGNVREFIELAARGDFEGAWLSRIKDNPFPSVCGRVCYHPCVSECSRAMLDEPVNIPLIEMTLGDAALEKMLEIPDAAGAKRPEKIAVIGGGPAGLSCAYQLGLQGFGVVIFEKQSVIGGLIRWGIPPYRLPRGIVEQEIFCILQLKNIKFETGCEIGKEEFGEIHKNFDAVFVASGALKETMLELTNRESRRIIKALDFLKKSQSLYCPRLGEKVIVVGGGNTALDAARTAVRMKSVKEVKIFYRRSRKEMPASREEITAAAQEGVKFYFLMAPQKAVFDGLTLKGLECIEMELGEPDESGRRRPIPKEKSEFFVETDSVILAIGQEPDLSFLSYYPDSSSLEQGLLYFAEKGIFFGGDAINKKRFLAQAIGSGKFGAFKIAKFLGQTVASVEAAPLDKQMLNTDYFEISSKLKTIHRKANERIKDFDETYIQYPAAVVKEEANRCFRCGICTACDNCFKFCPDIAVKKIDGLYQIDYDFCKGCGICVQECPRGAMSIEKEGK